MFLRTIAAGLAALLALCACDAAVPEKQEEVKKQVAQPARPPGASEPGLTITSGDVVRSFSRAELLKRSDLKTRTIADKSAYDGQTLQFVTVPLAALFEGVPIPEGADILFECTDGFSAPMRPSRLLNRDPKKSVAYLAIETNDSKWPALKPGRPTAGPYYVVWERPNASHIGREEWPYMLSGFRVSESLAKLYPEVLPDATLSDAHPVWSGFRVFAKECFPCHTMNRAGASEFGPDLNVPMSPVEYFAEGMFRKFIRNPRSLRLFQKSKMAPFGPEHISDEHLDHLLAYFEHMKGRKTNIPESFGPEVTQLANKPTAK